MAYKAALLAGVGRLGIPIVEDLVEKGWKTAVSYRAGKGSEKTVKGLADRLGYESVFPVEASVADPDDAERFVAAGIERYGRIDALLCIASGYPSEKQDWQRWEKGEGLTEDDWRYYDSNFFSARNPALSLLGHRNNPAEDLNIIFFSDARSLLYMDPGILDPYSGYGGIVEVTPETAGDAGIGQLQKIAPPREINPYTLAKRDLGHLARVLALRFQGGRCRVNAVAPGPIIPPPDKSMDKAQAVVEQTLLKRWGGTDPIVGTIEFFLENEFISGEIIRVDGGFFLYNRFKNG